MSRRRRPFGSSPFFGAPLAADADPEGAGFRRVRVSRRVVMPPCGSKSCANAQEPDPARRGWRRRRQRLTAHAVSVAPPSAIAERPHVARRSLARRSRATCGLRGARSSDRERPSRIARLRAHGPVETLERVCSSRARRRALAPWSPLDADRYRTRYVLGASSIRTRWVAGSSTGTRFTASSRRAKRGDRS